MLIKKFSLLILLSLSLFCIGVKANVCEKFKVNDTEIDLTLVEQTVDFVRSDFSGKKTIRAISDKSGTLNLSLTFQGITKPNKLRKKIRFVLFDAECNKILAVNKKSRENFITDKENSTLTYTYTTEIDSNNVFYIKLLSKNKRFFRGKRSSKEIVLNTTFTEASNDTEITEGDNSGEQGGDNIALSGNDNDEPFDSDPTERDKILEMNDNVKLHTFDLIDNDDNEFLNILEYIQALLNIKSHFNTNAVGPILAFDYNNDGVISTADIAAVNDLARLCLSTEAFSEYVLLSSAASKIDTLFDAQLSVKELIQALLNFKKHFNQVAGSASYSVEFDYNGDGRINTQDLPVIVTLAEMFLSPEKLAEFENLSTAANKVDTVIDALLSVSEFANALNNISNSYGSISGTLGYSQAYDYNADGAISTSDIVIVSNLMDMFLTVDQKNEVMSLI